MILPFRISAGRGRGQAGLDLAEPASQRQGVHGPRCGRIPSAWVRDQVRQRRAGQGRARRMAHAQSGSVWRCSTSRTRIRWAPGWLGVGSDKPCSRYATVETNPLPLSPLSLSPNSPVSPYPALLLIQEVRPGPRLSGKGKGRARHFGRNPTSAHAHFAELGLAPRPEGKEPSRLKASSNYGVAWERIRRPIRAILGVFVERWFACLAPGLLSCDYYSHNYC